MKNVVIHHHIERGIGAISRIADKFIAETSCPVFIYRISKRIYARGQICDVGLVCGGIFMGCIKCKNCFVRFTKAEQQVVESRESLTVVQGGELKVVCSLLNII